MSLYVFSYDLPTDKPGRRRRRKLVRLLEEFGDRVQYSVFELRLSGPGDLAELEERTRELLDETVDRVRIYPIHKTAEANIILLGEGEVYDVPPGFFL